MFRFPLPHNDPVSVGTWKCNCWKRNQRFRLFTTHLQASESDVGHVISTNISIARRFKIGNVEEAHRLFDQMPHRTVSFSAVLSACARSGSLLLVKHVHSLLLKSGYERFGLARSALLYFCLHCCGTKEAEVVFEELRDGNQVLWSLMLAGYVQRDMIDDAMDVFEKMHARDVVAWTTLISGYAKGEDGCEKPLDLFGCMRRSSEVLPNEFTLDCVVRVCARLGILCAGKVVHRLCIKGGFDFDNSIVVHLLSFIVIVKP
ncbi:hypothetical protein AAZX31_02G130600 [Glycine max]